MIKKINIKNNYRNSKGNITILVLIMGIAVILLTSAMVSFLFRDIGFTELDKNKLRALNFAEAGISNMFLNIEKYNNGEITSLPSSGYSGNVSTDEGLEGTYIVDYETYTSGGSYKIYGFTITSKGVDKSGVSRKVRVNILALNIYDFIYSEESLSSAENIAGNTTIVGPFLVNGELDVTVGTAQFLEGPLFVKGNIIIGGDASIGAADSPIDLFLGGNMFDVNGSMIDPKNPPGNRNIYVDNFYNSVFEIRLPKIDDSYIEYLKDLGASVINGDLYIQEEEIIIDGDVLVPHDSDDDLYFNDDGILEIKGNIIVEGNIYIGETTGTKYTINYKGKGNLVSTGNTYVYSQLIPSNNLISFPADDLMVLTTKQNIYLNLNGSLGGTGIDNPNAAIMCIANDTTELENGVILRGSTVSNSLITDQNAYVYYEEGIGNELPLGVPQFNNILFTLDWQEIID